MKKLLLVSMVLALTGFASAVCTTSGVAPNITYTAASPSQSDVQACITLESATPVNGDIISIPAGTGVWTSGFTWTPGASVTIQGAGAKSSPNGGGAYSKGILASIPGTCVSSPVSLYNATDTVALYYCDSPNHWSLYAPIGTDQTIIEDNITHNGTGPALLTITTTLGNSFRLTGIAFTTTPTNVSNASGGIVIINGTSQTVRVDHNHLATSATPGIGSLNLTLSGDLAGVADHNWVDMSVNAIFVNHGKWALSGVATQNGDGSWADNTNWGGARFVFLEDNTFNQTRAAVVYANDCNYGGRIVIRSNTLLNGAGIQQHEESSQNQGCRAIEFYRNNFINLSANISLAYYGRSGLTLEHSNTIDNYTSVFTYHIDRADYQNNFHKPWPLDFGMSGGTTPFRGTVTISGATATGSGFNTSLAAGTPVWLDTNGTRVACTGTPNGCTVSSVTNSTTLVLNGVPTTTCNATCTLAIGSPWDGNTDIYGYPGFDQMSRGKGDLLSGGFPNRINLSILTGGLGSFTVQTPGTGCVQGDLLNVVQGGASGGVVKVATCSGAGVATVTGYLSGTGYAVANGLSITTSGTEVGTTINLTGLVGWPHNALEPAYIFNQTFYPGGATPHYIGISGTGIQSNVFQEGRDYYAERPNYDTGASFTGSIGVGVGLLAARLIHGVGACCTAGVGWWATDAQTLYVSSGSAWSTYYTPYTYPHPLVSSSILPASRSLSRITTNGVTHQ